MKITVVTICRNAAVNIRETIESVISQTYKDFEYVVVDGVSTDGTLDIIKEYQHAFPIRLISEKDENLFDAMNKGARMALGQWVNFMNAGDFFMDKDVLSKISGYLTSERDLVYGATEFRYDGFAVIRKPLPVSDFWKKMPYNHQSLFIKTDIINEHLFKYHDYFLAADYEQLLFAIKEGKVFFEAPVTVASFDNKGLSNTRTAMALAEYAKILKTYGELTAWRGFYYKMAPLKVLGKKLSPLWFRKVVYKNLVH